MGCCDCRCQFFPSAYVFDACSSMPYNSWYQVCDDYNVTWSPSTCTRGASTAPLCSLPSVDGQERIIATDEDGSISLTFPTSVDYTLPNFEVITGTLVGWTVIIPCMNYTFYVENDEEAPGVIGWDCNTINCPGECYKVYIIAWYKCLGLCTGGPGSPPRAWVRHYNGDCGGESFVSIGQEPWQNDPMYGQENCGAEGENPCPDWLSCFVCEEI